MRQFESKASATIDASCQASTTGLTSPFQLLTFHVNKFFFLSFHNAFYCWANRRLQPVSTATGLAPAFGTQQTPLCINLFISTTPKINYSSSSSSTWFTEESPVLGSFLSSNSLWKRICKSWILAHCTSKCAPHSLGVTCPLRALLRAASHFHRAASKDGEPRTSSQTLDS